MNRRSFFGLVFGGAAAAVVAPLMPAVKSNTCAAVPDVLPRWVPIPINQQFGVDFEWDSAAAFRERYLRPAMEHLVRKDEAAWVAMCSNV